MTARRFTLPALVALGLISVAMSLSFGAVWIAPRCAWSALWPSDLGTAGCPDPQLMRTVLALRLPRLLLGICVGSGLGLSGAALQGLFRNPLVDPGLIGVSSGAALFASTLMVLGSGAMSSPPMLLAAGFLGGLIAAVSVQRLSQVRGRIMVPALILAGVAINAIAGALIGLLSYIASDAQLRSLTFWTLGSLSGATWPRVLWAGGVSLVATALILRLSSSLHVLVLGESAAAHLGIAIDSLKRQALLFSVLLVASSVALCGIIGFVGLIVPHVVRMLVGPDQRRVLPGSAILGAVLLLWADLISRSVVAPAELPLGTVTAALGSPVFLTLILRERQRWAT